MRQDLVDITVVLDRSGSMQSCQEKAERGLNEFIRQQKELPGEAVFTLVQFDDQYEIVHNGIPIKDVPHCKLEPRNNTALNDAIARAIHAVGDRLKNTPEDQRPGLVVFVILTDGQENASKEYFGDVGRSRIKEMIKHQQDVYKWQFTFLGANQDAFTVAGGYGISAAASANYGASSSDLAFAGASSNLRRMRSASGKGQDVLNAYSDKERDAMK